MDAGGSISTLNVPGYTNTILLAINDEGEIVGQATNDDTFNTSDAFVDIGGVFTILDVPGANYTEAFAVNTAGQILGYYQDPDGASGPFLATPSIPEPSTWAMMALGFAGLGLAGRRRAKARLLFAA